MLNLKFLSLLCLIVAALSLRDPSSMIFYSNLTSPFQQTIRTYGNYDFKVNSFNFTGANEKKAAQSAIQFFISHYGKTQYPKQAQYSLEYYQDSSLSAVAYILYKKMSLSATTRYYCLRVREGARRGTIYQLGSDRCTNCMVGKQLLFGYQQYSEGKINQMGQDIVNIVNSIRNMKLQASSVKQIKAWNFPKGKLLIANISAPSSTLDILVSMLSTPQQYLLYLNGYSIPKVYSNLPIDFSYLSGYMFRILQASNLTFSNQTNLRTFEYILDENFKNTITFSLRFVNQQLSGVIKLYNGAVGSTFPSPHDIYLHPSIYFRNQSFTPYFNYDDPQPKIGSNTTSQKQSKQLQLYLTNKLNYPIDYIDFIYIDFASNRRQYNVVYNDTKTGDIIQAIVVSNRSINNSYGFVYRRVALPNQTYTESKDVLESYWGLYEISDYYGMINYNLNYSFTPAEITAAEVCTFSSEKFEIGMIYNNNPSRMGSKDYCMSRKIFIKNLSSNRTNFLGQSIASSSQCTYFGLKAFIAYSCPLNQPEEVSQTIKSKIFQKIGERFIDSKGVAFSESLLTKFIGFGLQSFGIGKVYYAEFNRDDVSSYFLVQQSNDSYLIIDNMEGVTPSNYPTLLAGPNSSINSTNSSSNNASSGSPSSQLIVEQNSVLKSIGNGQLPLQFVVNQYKNLMDLIKKNTDSSNIASKPTIFYYIDESINFFAFAVLFPYVYSVFEVYQIVKLQNTNQYYFMGRKYIPSIPSTYWSQSLIPQSSSSQILSQATPIINDNAACFNVPVRSYKINNVAMANGGYYTINAQIMNGYIASIGLFRIDTRWIKVYSQFRSYQGENNIDSKAVMVVMSKSQVDKDLGFKQSLGLLNKQVSSLGNIPISKIEKGVYSNGTTKYQITFDQSATSKILITFLFDPSSKKILYLDNSSTSSIKEPATNPSRDRQALSKVLQFLTQKYPIIKNYQSIKSEVNYIQGSPLFSLKIKSLDRNTYIADVLVAAPSTPNEKITVISFYRQL